MIDADFTDGLEAGLITLLSPGVIEMAKGLLAKVQNDVAIAKYLCIYIAATLISANMHEIEEEILSILGRAELIDGVKKIMKSVNYCVI